MQRRPTRQGSDLARFLRLQRINTTFKDAITCSKAIQARTWRLFAADETDQEEVQQAELEEVPVDLNHIERWRRGVSDADTASIATSVDEEFMTPGAAKSLRKEGKLPSAKEEKKQKEKAKLKEKKEKEARDNEKKKEKELKKTKSDKSEKKEKMSISGGMRMLSRKEKAAPGVDFL